ncbi:MAG: hypothetical protein ACSW8A_06475, partial [Lachnospiraceae bacterium]
KKAGLIKNKRQGLGKPSLIYVLKFSTVCPQKDSESHFKKCENHTSGDVKTTHQEMWESHGNKTNQNQTENNKTDLIHLPEDRSRYQDRIAGADRGDGGILSCEPGLSAAGRDRIQQQGEERHPDCHRESDEDCAGTLNCILREEGREIIKQISLPQHVLRVITGLDFYL